jgi:chemotaxis protein histidine kinase CheA
MMSLSSSSLRALTQNDLNRTASETTVCSKRKIESCESIISFKRQKTIFCCLSKTYSIDTLSSTIIKHARISLIFLFSLFHFDQTSQFFNKKLERSRVEKTSKALKKKREKSEVEKSSEVLKKRHEKSRVEKKSEVLKKKRERCQVEKTSKASKNKNERSRKFDQASKKEKKMSQKRDKATQKKKKRSRKYDKASKKKNERSQQIDFIRASNSNLHRKIAQIMKNTKMTRQHETILKRRLRERIDRKTRHVRQYARVIRKDDTFSNTIIQTSQSLRDIVSFSSRQNNSFFSNYFEFSVILVQNSIDYRTCVRCDLLRIRNRFFTSFDVEYCD